MMTTVINQAASLLAKNQPLTVSAGPLGEPGPREILVRTRAIALNPFDGVVQRIGSSVAPWLKYPAILGTEVAGEVVTVGSAVKRFKVNDRVVGLAMGCDKLDNHACSPAAGVVRW